MTFLDPSLNIALKRMQHIIQQMRQLQTADSINLKECCCTQQFVDYFNIFRVASSTYIGTTIHI